MRIVLIILVVVIVVGAGFFFLSQNKKTSNVSETREDKLTSMEQATPTPMQSSESSSVASEPCKPSQLKAVASTDVAAGNAYVTLTLQNTSDSSCQVIGNNFPEVQYPLAVQNFKMDQKGTPANNTFTLAPNQTIYSLIHFPNGPQCSSQATDVNAAVSYQISSADSVTFTPTSGPTVDIPSCGKNSDITMIDLYPFSTQPVTPN